YPACYVKVTVDFFFQAEDGIRDRNVTGVQTCALPISDLEDTEDSEEEASEDSTELEEPEQEETEGTEEDSTDLEESDQEETEDRSEERRVGKECRARSTKKHRK